MGRYWGIGRCVILTMILFCTALAAISFGIAYGVEKDLTGEDFWQPGHMSLFRICETADTSASTVRVHTCNVFAPGWDTGAQPKQAFTELNQNWYPKVYYRGYEGAWPLDELLRMVNLKCEVSDPAVGTRGDRAQIIIGQVGQRFARKTRAIACNYKSDGSTLQDHCGEYEDGGSLAGGTPHPLSINQIFEKHFGRGNCSFIAN